MAKMTSEYHDKIIMALEKEIKRRRQANKKLPTLQEKIMAQREVKLLEEQKRNFLLNYYDLVDTNSVNNKVMEDIKARIESGAEAYQPTHATAR